MIEIDHKYGVISHDLRGLLSIAFVFFKYWFRGTPKIRTVKKKEIMKTAFRTEKNNLLQILKTIINNNNAKPTTQLS